MWAIEIFSLSGDYKALPVLIDFLTYKNKEISRAAYKALVSITGKDPLKIKKMKINSPGTIKIFIEDFNQHIFNYR